jgi:membrane-associated phospholipid phosphatase
MKTTRFTLSSLLRVPELPWLCAMVAALAVLVAAVTQSATIDRLDTQTTRGFERHATHEGTEWNFLITHLGSTELIVLLTLGIVAVLLVKRHWRGAVALTVSVAATQLVVQLVKMLIERPRPVDSIIDASGFSFPSGHAATSVAFYATIALLAARPCRSPARIAIATAAGLVVLAVGATRIYLGAHYPTDVLAGWLTGGILMLGSWLAVSRLRLLDGRPGVA